MYKSFVELKEVYHLHLVLIQIQTDVDSIPVIVQSPGSFLSCFLLSITLSSLRMKMLPFLGCLLSSSMPLFFCFGILTRLPMISHCFYWPFLATFLLGRTSRTTDIGFSNILHAPF